MLRLCARTLEAGSGVEDLFSVGAEVVNFDMSRSIGLLIQTNINKTTGYNLPLPIPSS